MSGALLSRQYICPSCSWRQETRSKQIYLFTTRRKFPVYRAPRLAQTLSCWLKLSCVDVYLKGRVTAFYHLCRLVPLKWTRRCANGQRKRTSEIWPFLAITMCCVPCIVLVYFTFDNAKFGLFASTMLDYAVCIVERCTLVSKNLNAWRYLRKLTIPEWGLTLMNFLTLRV